MVLSNAERQARYRKNIKARANDPGAAARAAADAAVSALWAFLVRAEAEGQRWAEKDGCDTLDQFRASIAANDPVSFLRAWSEEQEDGMAPEEFAAIRAVIEIDDALKLKHARDA